MFMHYLGNINRLYEFRKLCLFSHAVYRVLKTVTALACYILDIHQPILIFFVDNNVVVLCTVCKYYFLRSQFVFETRYAA